MAPSTLFISIIIVQIKKQQHYLPLAADLLCSRHATPPHHPDNNMISARSVLTIAELFVCNATLLLAQLSENNEISDAIGREFIN